MDALQQWTKATVDSFCEFAASTLRMNNVEEGEHMTEPPRGTQGAYLPILTPNAALHIGIVADRDILQQLACTLMMLDTSEKLSDDEIVDACSEISNVIGGMVKGLMKERVGQIQLGLPLFSFDDIDWRATAQCQIVQVCDSPKLSIIVVYSDL